jgi:glycerol transport system ATP-binding protein
MVFPPKDTAIILLDEPMTQLDLHQRWFLRKELKKIQQRLNMTMIYVTHDQYEALSFAEKIVVMKDGNIVQEGTPETLYDYPNTSFVGWFIGTPGMNIYNFSIKDNMLDFNDFKINMPQNMKEILKGRTGMLQLGIRPEYVRYSKEEAKEGFFLTKLISIENMGYFKVLTLKVGDTVIKGKVLREVEINEGQETWVSITEDEVNLRIYENGVLITK